MISEALKKALLQAAIQGKLTEQLPEDGDARDLLKEIQKEKARLIKEGKIKKEKPLPEIKEEEIPFDIPENWTWVRLGDLILLKSGQDMTPDKYHAKTRGIPYITGASNFNNGNVTIDRWTESPRSIAYEGDLLITCKGTVGEMAFLRESQAHIARQVMAIKNVGKLNLSYIHYLLKWFVTELVSMAKSLIPGISREMVLSIVTPLPPLQEQERIVKKLELLLPELEDLKAEETKLENLEKAFPGKIRASILQAAIQGKLTEQLPGDGDARDLLKEIQEEKTRLIKEGRIKKEKPLPEITEDEIPFDIPENWAWCHLGSVTTLISSKPFQIFEKEILSEGLFPVVSQGKKLIEGYSNRQEKLLNHEKPIIVFGDHTKNLKLIDFDFIVGADGTKLLQPIGILPEYLFRNLEYNVISIGTRNYGRHFSLLNSVLIAVPPIEEQKRIIKDLVELMPLCDALE